VLLGYPADYFDRPRTTVGGEMYRSCNIYYEPNKRITASKLLKKRMFLQSCLLIVSTSVHPAVRASSPKRRKQKQPHPPLKVVAAADEAAKRFAQHQD